jgi:hypothetical protein
MGIRRKIQRRTIREQRRAKERTREQFLTTYGSRGECDCPICDYLESIGAESEDVGDATVHRLSEDEMVVVKSLMHSGPLN